MGNTGPGSAPDARKRRETALALHLRVCRGAEHEAVAALAELSGRELGWTTAESDVLLARLVGKDALVAPHELQGAFLALVPVALAAAEQAEEFDRARVGSLRRSADSPSLGRGDELAALRDRMDALLRREPAIVPGRLPHHLLDGLDAYGPAMRAAHGDLLTGPGAALLLGHCALLDRTRPTRAWRRRAAALLAGAGRGEELVRRLLEGVAAQPEHRVSDLAPLVMVRRDVAGDTNTSLARGLLWSALDIDADWVVPLVGAVALHAGTGAGGSGTACRSRPLATAAVAVLGACEGGRREEAARRLGRLAGTVRNRALAKEIARALEAVAAPAGR
ncbi:hypothetical protein ACFY8C_07390 [Streptomyces flavochromogenes]|uniref:HEAT repeat domain-containing protein n=1 Tax=Streptomyces flavochromogenes TaxID=68199 RepID=A0ABW6XKY2_9ACTN|nr:hypothetical protein [Streptomyces flavochromogenes]